MSTPPSSASSAAPQGADQHDRWFRAKIDKALNSTEPYIPHDEVMEHILHKLYKYAPDLDI